MVCALVTVATLALATACGGITGQATLTPTPPPTASLPSSPTTLPSETPTATEIPTTAGRGTPTALPTESAAGLVVVTRQLAGQPTLDPLSFTTVQGQALSHEDLVIGEPFLYQWLDDQPGMWAMVGEDRLVASEHYSDDGSQGWVTVTRGDEEIYRIETGMANPMSGLQGFFAYDGHWVLETNFYTDDDPFTGKITVDGVLLNEQEGYDKAFNAQTVAGKLFYLFQRDGRIDAWYDGQVVALGYDDVPHYACCSGAEMNPYKGLDAVSFFGVRSGTWYFVQISASEAASPPATTETPTPAAQGSTVMQQAAELPYGPPIHDAPVAAYETVFQILVGENGVRYQGGVEMQTTGPNGLAVLPDGTFFIADLLDNRLLHYSPEGKLLNKIELADLGIVNVSDMVASPAELYLLETSFNVAPERYRVSRLSFDGDLIGRYDIPQGYHLEDGLYGLAPAGSNGEILLELYGAEMKLYQLADRQGLSSREVAGIPAYGRVYRMILAADRRAIPAILVDDLRLESQMTLGGLIKVLAVNADGTLYVVREDMVSDSPVIQGDITIHFISTDGIQLAVARYPLSEWEYFVQRAVAVGPDGNVYGLLPRADTVDILRLNFTPRIDPLIPGATEPYVGRADS